MVLVAVQLSVLGLYLPPVFKRAAAIISTPDDHLGAGPHCGVNPRAAGALVILVGCPTIRRGIVSPAGVQGAAVAIYPPQTIISLPVQTAV